SAPVGPPVETPTRFKPRSSLLHLNAWYLVVRHWLLRGLKHLVSGNSPFGSGCCLMTSGTSWVFISGAGSGIGEAVARNLAARGMKLIVTDVDADAARRVATALSSEYEEAIWFGLDVSKPEQIEDVFSNLHRNDVCVQTAVNCAGVPGRKELLHSI